MLVYYLIPEKEAPFETTSTESTTTSETTSISSTTTSGSSTTTESMEPTTTVEPTTISGSTTTSPQSTSTLTPPSDFLISRSEWTSDPLNGDIKPLADFPIKRIIVGQTDDSLTCTSKGECISKIQSIRSSNSDLMDIPWNFLIGGDGRVYEGRGYKHEGEHSSNWNATDFNDIGIGIGLIGNFESVEVPVVMQAALNEFLTQSTSDGNFSSDFIVFQQDQLIYRVNEATGVRNMLLDIPDGRFYESKKNIFVL